MFIKQQGSLLKFIFIFLLLFLFTACKNNSSTVNLDKNKEVNSTEEGIIKEPIVEENIDEIVGYLVDAPIANMGYSCGDKVDKTDSKGKFTCFSLPVKFFINDIEVGTINSMTIDSIIYPQDLVGVARENIENKDVLKIASFLQSLDTTKDISTIITIPNNIVINSTNKVLPVMTQNEVTQLLIDNGIEPTTPEEAKEHLQENLELSLSPSPSPTLSPSPSPTLNPSPSPTLSPSPSPTLSPSPSPTLNPSPSPTLSPSPSPTLNPSPSPTLSPSPNPTLSPSPSPTLNPSPSPTLSPSPSPTLSPSPSPTLNPSPSPTLSPSPSPTLSPSPTPLKLIILTDKEWNNLAVRKVLHTFAYGGHATDAQIDIWANMSPEEAIKEILTFDTQNQKLSPPQSGEDFSTLKTLTDIGNFMYEKRDKSIYYSVDWATSSDSSLWRNWGASVLLRGLNPFASKIGLWETNYHMSANQEVIFYSNIMYAYYEDIMAEHQKNKSYDNIMAKASWSHAISKQYGFTNTRYYPDNDKFSLLNEDFAREFHQLFFCNLGEYNPTYHEKVSIKNTAKALTGLKNCYGDGHFLAHCEPDPDHHYSSNLEILNQEIVGNDISEKMGNLAKVALIHKESLNNLPIYIISSLADDNMDDTTKEKIQNSWKNLESKNFLDFIRLYAISTSFHSPNRVKYQSSIDRSVLFWNKLMTDNNALYINGYAHYFLEMNEEGVRPFYLKHNVFGHQTGIESVNSAYSISQMLSNRIKLYDFYCRTVANKDGEDIYHKKWSSTIPPDSSGGYTKGYVIKWLWNNLIADNLKNYGVLERAHLLALISGKDLGYFLDENNPTKVYNSTELQTKEIEDKLKVLEEESIDVDSSAYNINRAMTFIGATPYVFIEEGK